MNFPSAFRQKMQDQLKSDFKSFENSIASAPPVSIRFNSKKSESITEPSKIAWCNQGRYLATRPSFTLDPLFHAGVYYVQEASSMVLDTVIRQLFPSPHNLNVLDLCAAPGGKTTLLADIFDDSNLIVSNEVIRSRFNVLKENTMKWGHANQVLLCTDPEKLSKVSMRFDLILVDAPCSGEGLFRKDPAAMSHWKPDSPSFCALRQKRILENAMELLAPNGILLYSTCTYNNLENINQNSWLQEHYGLKSIPVELNQEWGFEEINKGNAIGYQSYPHKVKGEGFFFTLLRKQKEEEPTAKRNKRAAKENQKLWPRVPNEIMEVVNQKLIDADSDNFFFHDNEIHYFPKELQIKSSALKKAMPKAVYGTNIGSVKKGSLIPHHALAMSSSVGTHHPIISLDKESALRFLKKESIEKKPAKKGWHLVQYQGVTLGWMKALGNRNNNYYPSEYRIRMRLE